MALARFGDRALEKRAPFTAWAVVDGMGVYDWSWAQNEHKCECLTASRTPSTPPELCSSIKSRIASQLSVLAVNREPDASAVTGDATVVTLPAV